nr:zinc finger, CCHC-type [Tanacetum cinerariifolium]
SRGYFSVWATGINENKKVQQVSVDSKGFFKVRFVDVLAMKNTSIVLRRSQDSGIVSGFCRGKDEGFAGTTRISCSIGGVTCSHDSKNQSEHIDKFHKLVRDLEAIDTVISKKDHYDNFVKTLLYGRDTLKLEDVLATLNSRELQKMTEAKGHGGEGLYVRGRSGQNRYGEGYNHKNPQGFFKIEDQVFGSGADGYDSVDVMMAMGVEELLDKIMDSGGSYHITYRRDYLVDFEEYDDGGRECRIRGTGKGFTMKMQSGKIKVIKGSLVVLSGTRRANCVHTLDDQAMTRKTLKGRKQFEEYQTGWKIKIGNVLDSCNQRNMDFNKSREYKETFIGSGVVAEVDKNYAYESLTFNNTVACEVIYKWKARLKDDMDARTDVYVLSNGCKKCSDDNDVYYWEYTPAKGNVLGMEIVMDQSANTLRVSQSRFYNEKLVQTLLEGHSILSLDGSLLGDCDVEKNDTRTDFEDFDNAMGRSITIMGRIITRYGSMIQGCVGSWEAYVQYLEAMSIIKAAYIILTEAAKEAIWLKGLAIELGFELKIVAYIATRSLSKTVSKLRRFIKFVEPGFSFIAQGKGKCQKLYGFTLRFTVSEHVADCEKSTNVVMRIGPQITIDLIFSNHI